MLHLVAVATINIVRILLSLATNCDWMSQQFVVKNAFLHGDLKEKVYMDAPPRFNKIFTINHVCKPKKALYELKQSPRPWFGRFTKAMIEMEFQQSQEDHTLSNALLLERSLLIVYIDDIIITSDDLEEIKQLKQRLAKEFEIKNLGKLKVFSSN